MLLRTINENLESLNQIGDIARTEAVRAGSPCCHSDPDSKGGVAWKSPRKLSARKRRPKKPSTIEDVVSFDSPICTIVCGADGAGRSTFAKILPLPGVSIDPEAIAAELGEHASPLAAGRETLRRMDWLLAAHQSFHFEASLSGRHTLSLMRRAKTLGYVVDLAIIVLASAPLHLARVDQRVAQGGRATPDATVRRRFESGFIQLGEAARLADECVVLDNSGLTPVIIAALRHGERIARRTVCANSAHARFFDCLPALNPELESRLAA